MDLHLLAIRTAQNKVRLINQLGARRPCDPIGTFAPLQSRHPLAARHRDDPMNPLANDWPLKLDPHHQGAVLKVKSAFFP